MAKLMVAGDLYTDLANTEGAMRAEEIAIVLWTAGLEYMSSHIFPRCKNWSRDVRTWIMRHGYQVVKSRTDYLLVTDHSLYKNLLVQYARHNNDQYLVFGCLRGASAWEHVYYLGNKCHFSLCPPRITSNM